MRVNADTAQRSSRHLVMHFTHIRNLPGILEAGCLRADSTVDRRSELIVEAADLSIKATRKTVRVPLEPYGCVADYVPFYFAPRSPMLYKLAKGSVPTYSDGQDSLVYLVSTVETIAQAGLRYLFSDGNCASAATRFADDLRLLDSMVDWELMDAQMWCSTADDPDRRRRRMAEFLVHDRVPVTLLVGIAVRAKGPLEQVNGILAAHGTSLRVLARPGWYF